MKGLLLSAIQDPDPVLFIETGMTLFSPGEVAADQGPIPLGKAKVAVPGSDVTIVTWAAQTIRCMMALEGLAAAGYFGRDRRSAHHFTVGQGHRAGLGRQDRAGDGGA